MDIRPTALNVLIIGLSVVVFQFIWRLLAGWIEASNPEMAGAMGVVA